jgi:hypothetical protein
LKKVAAALRMCWFRVVQLAKFNICSQCDSCPLPLEDMEIPQMGTSISIHWLEEQSAGLAAERRTQVGCRTPRKVLPEGTQAAGGELALEETLLT